jgi:mono/diheme cytochrome c family protein
MKMNRLPFLLVLLMAFALGLSCQKKPEVKPVDFVTQIKPLLQSRCVNCHHSGALFGDLSFESRALAMQPRKSVAVITPGQPGASQLYIALTLPDPDKKAMPPTGHRIPNSEVELVKRWIEEGAKWPDGPEGAIKPTVTQVPGKA